MTVTIRSAQHADAQSIARLHYQTWRETYRDLAPEAIFEVMIERVRLSRWQEMLALERRGRTILLAEANGQLAGFGVAGPPSHEVFLNRAEVKFLYVDAAFKRMGIGRNLLIQLARHKMEFGYGGIALGVVVGNDPAIAFYEALGGQRAGRYTDPGPVWRSENFIYAWDDLPWLIGSGASREPVGG